MEIVCDDEPQENTMDNIPVKIWTHVKELNRRVKCEIVYADPKLMRTLDKFELTPEKIREQLVECWMQGKTPTQLSSIFFFLMQHHTAIVRGQTPIPLTSKFRKIPFPNK